MSTHSTDCSTKETVEDVGVIVGRFQTPYLHEGHRELISRVVSKHKRTIIFLGVSPNKRSRQNPLDFESRRLMILASVPGVIILPLSDMKEDRAWSHQLDTKIAEVCLFSSVRLYGGRDSFIAHYLGSLPTTEIESVMYHSATSLRNAAGNDVKASSDWRAGVIYGAYNQYPKCWPTVDIAPIRTDEKRNKSVLMARKPNEAEWRFIGGFVDPTDNSLEEAAKREVTEESRIETSNYRYVSSRKIDDWRYRDDVDKIMTTFFVADYTFGSPQPQDDIQDLAWFTFDYGSRSFFHTAIVYAHIGLYNDLYELAQKEGWCHAKTSDCKTTSSIG